MLSMRVRKLISLLDLQAGEIEEIFLLSERIKAAPEKFSDVLAGKTLGLIFQRPSTRTRVSFQVGMRELGGLALYLSARDLQLGRGESAADTGRVLSRYLDVVVVRAGDHKQIVEFAESAEIPVVNGLSKLLHPCEILADCFTLLERRGELSGLHLAFLGEGNNISHTLLQAGARLGFDVTIVCPEGFGPKAEILSEACEAAAATGARLEVSNSIDSVDGADVVYTDVWPAEVGGGGWDRRSTFLPYQVNAELMVRAAPDAIFMHCMPARRGEEVTSDVLDGPASIAFDKAANLLPVQKAILCFLMRD